jgi:hypothetical protein
MDYISKEEQLMSMKSFRENQIWFLNRVLRPKTKVELYLEEIDQAEQKYLKQLHKDLECDRKHRELQLIRNELVHLRVWKERHDNEKLIQLEKSIKEGREKIRREQLALENLEQRKRVERASKKVGPNNKGKAQGEKVKKKSKAKPVPKVERVVSELQPAGKGIYSLDIEDSGEDSEQPAIPIVEVDAPILGLPQEKKVFQVVPKWEPAKPKPVLSKGRMSRAQRKRAKKN